MKTSLTCEDVRGCFPLLVGDDLDEPSAPRMREQVREHLNACGACAAMYLSAERAREALLGLVREAPEDLDLWQDLHLRLRSEGILGARPRAAVVRPRTWRPLAAFAGAAAATLMLGIGVWTSSLPETTVAPQGPGPFVHQPVVHQPAVHVPTALRTTPTVAPTLLASQGAARPSATRTGIAAIPPQAAPVRLSSRAPVPFATLVSHGGGSRLTTSDPRSFARHVSDRRVLPSTSTVASSAAAPSMLAIGGGAETSGVPANAELGGLRRATREDELLRNSALPWRQYFHRTPNVPIYWGENATVGFGLR